MLGPATQQLHRQTQCLCCSYHRSPCWNPADAQRREAVRLRDLRCCLLQTELDAALKQTQQMQEEQEEQRKQAADAMAAAEEQHGLELQRLNVERSKLQVGGAGVLRVLIADMLVLTACTHGSTCWPWAA